MKILLFGGSGQVGHEFRSRASQLRFEVSAPVTSEVNICDEQQVLFLAEKLAPDVILNCAAYTAVDRAESEKEKAFEVNAKGAEIVAKAARQEQSRLIHLSTDYVYDGTATEPISEDFPVNPINVYGASKLAGENAIATVLGENGALILRTASVHGKAGNNIVHTILNLLETRDELQFVEDQVMSPTWAGWLAEVLLDLVRIECQGIMHAACGGQASWFAFAQEVLRLAVPHIESGDKKKILPVASSAFERPAKRPQYTVLNTATLSTVLGREPIAWQEGLKNHMQELGYE